MFWQCKLLLKRTRTIALRKIFEQKYKLSCTLKWANVGYLANIHYTRQYISKQYGFDICLNHTISKPYWSNIQCLLRYFFNFSENLMEKSFLYKFSRLRKCIVFRRYDYMTQHYDLDSRISEPNTRTACMPVFCLSFQCWSSNWSNRWLNWSFISLQKRLNELL